MQSHATARFAHPASNTDALGIEGGMVVADFGSGSGHYALHLAEQVGESGVVYAIDVQQALLERLKDEGVRRGFKNIEIIWGDVSRPRGSKIADRTVDLVLISNLLFQLEDPARALKEAWRVLKPAGRLAIIDWSDSPPVGGRRMGPTKAHVLKIEKALDLAHEAHFDLIHEFDAGSHHYGLILKPAPASRI